MKQDFNLINNFSSNPNLSSNQIKNQNDSSKFQENQSSIDQILDDDIKMAVSALNVMKNSKRNLNHQQKQQQQQNENYFKLNQSSSSNQNHNRNQNQNQHLIPSSPSLSSNSSSSTSKIQNHSNHSNSINHHQIDLNHSDQSVFQKVGRMSILSGVLKAYQTGKGTSRVVKYGADLVESSVNSLSGRVVSKVGHDRIAQIDKYAGAALDRLGQFSKIQSPTPNLHLHHLTPTNHHQLDHSNPFNHQISNHHHHLKSHSPHSSYSDHSILNHNLSSHSNLNTPSTSNNQNLIQVNNHGRSRWQNILVEASMTAGGIGAAFSQESMKSLKYCLEWLQYATAQLEHQITLLRNFITSLNIPQNSSNSNLSSIDKSNHLLDIKKEVVETIRKVVDVVSKYAGGALPDQAKQFVRNSILGLPLRWASIIQSQTSNSFNHQITNSSSTQIAADRILSFAVESLDMLKSLTALFAESVERADAWIERLRLIGIQHRNQRENLNNHSKLSSFTNSLDHQFLSTQSSSNHLQSLNPQNLDSIPIFNSPSSPLEFHSQSRIRSRNSSTSTCGETSNSSWISNTDHSISSIHSINITIPSSNSSHKSSFVNRMISKRRKANIDIKKRLSHYDHKLNLTGSSTSYQTNFNSQKSNSNSSITSTWMIKQNPTKNQNMIFDGLKENSTSSLKKLLIDPREELVI